MQLLGIARCLLSTRWPPSLVFVVSCSSKLRACLGTLQLSFPKNSWLECSTDRKCLLDGPKGLKSSAGGGKGKSRGSKQASAVHRRLHAQPRWQNHHRREFLHCLFCFIPVLYHDLPCDCMQVCMPQSLCFRGLLLYPALLNISLVLSSCPGSAKDVTGSLRM